MTPRIHSCTPTESLGCGSTGEVFAVAEASNVVLKHYTAMSVDRGLLARSFRGRERMPEIDGMETLYDHSLSSSPSAALLEKVSGKTLEEIGPLKEAQAWEIIRRIADALGHAHKYGVIHGHLHPGTIRVREEKEELHPVVLDFSTGLVGEIHHIDLGDSLFYAAPEQLVSGGKDWDEGAAQKWDVYSFGLIAYHLIHGDLPRGMHFLKHHRKEVAHQSGIPVRPDVDAYLEEVQSHPRIPWGISLTVSREHKLLREIIERCLALDPHERPVDMREVCSLFRDLDHQFALEHAEDRVTRERLKQKGKLIGARSLAACLGISFFLASYYLVDYLKKSNFFQNKVSELDQVVLTQKATIDHLDERWAETELDLKTSRAAADSFFQRMAQGDAAGGSGVSTLKEDDLEKSRVYYLKTLEDVRAQEDSALEQGRALHSLAHIERKMEIREKAALHFSDAAAVFSSTLENSDSTLEEKLDIRLRLADCYENLASLETNLVGAEALSHLQKAVAQFEEALLLEPDNVETVSRQAATSFLLGRAYDAHEAYSRAIEAYSRSAQLANDLQKGATEPSDSLTELIGRLQFSAALSLEKLAKHQEAIDAHIASMETLEKLRDIHGFTPLQSVQLATSYLHLGNLFRKQEATSEEQDQLFNEALRLLTPLNSSNPGDVEVAALLCQSLNELGELERAEGRWSDGYKLSVRGIETLKAALEQSETPPVSGLCILAESRLRLLAFLDSEEEAARNVITRGVETTGQIQEALNREDPAIEEPMRSLYRKRLISIFGNYAERCEDLGEAELARECREKAALQIAAVNSSDQLIIE